MDKVTAYCELVELLIADLTDDLTEDEIDLTAREVKIATLCRIVGESGIKNANAAAYTSIKNTRYLASGRPNELYEEKQHDQ